MKLAAFSLFCGSSAVLAADIQLRVIRHKEPVTIEDSGRFGTNAIAFVESASVDATSSGGDSNAWQNVLVSDSFVHLTFTPPRNFRLPVMGQSSQEWIERPVGEILVSLPEGHYPTILVRSGTNYMSVTKYAPLALKRLIVEPALGLSNVPPYDYFYRLKPPGR